MSFTAACECGATFDLKDEYSGRTLACPTCNRTFLATAAPPVATVAQADSAFDRDKFLLRQKVMAINEKYDVGDEQNRPILFIERPAHLMQTLAALLLGLLAFAIVFVLCLVAAVQLFQNDGGGFTIVIVSGIILGIAASLTVGIALSPKRHVVFYRDLTKTEKLMDILQDAKFQPINATYTARDREGNVLCRFRKNILYNFFRKRWYCNAPDGTMLCVAMEDSIVLSLLRRFLGPLFGLLRTNYIITPAGSEQIIGEFNRKFTLFDRYVLDLTADPGRLLDRRIALALGVMLDTGERR